MEKLKLFVLAAGIYLNLGCGPNLTNRERLERISDYYTNLEMANFRRQGLELEARVNGEVSANIWTTIDSRMIMEQKKGIIEKVSGMFMEQSAYFNSFCLHPVNEVEIVIDRIDDFGSVPLNSRIIILDEEILESIINNGDFKEDVIIIHEYAHVQHYWQDQDESRMYKEMAAIIAESLNLIRVHGYERYNQEYLVNFPIKDFNPLELLGDGAQYFAIRILVKQFFVDSFEGNITWQDNSPILEKMEQFTGFYFAEEANGQEGFDNTAKAVGLVYSGRELRLSDIRRDAFENSVR